ncbi:MAG: hypothetical protein ACPGEC_01695 [Flavobacteriales bacterium]
MPEMPKSLCTLILLLALTPYSAFSQSQSLSSQSILNPTHVAYALSESDSNQAIGFGFDDYYGVKNLNAYRFFYQRPSDVFNLKINYQFFQENVFRRHKPQLSVGKTLLKHVQVQCHLGVENWQDDQSNQRWKEIWGFGLSYQAVEHVFVNFHIENEHFRVEKLNYEFALQYQVSEELHLFGEWREKLKNEAVLGLNYRYRTFVFQVQHQFMTAQLGVGCQYVMDKINLGLLYQKHPQLGGQIQTQLVYNI